MLPTPLIKQLQEDTGAVGAGSVAFAATPLFATLVRRSKKPKLTAIKAPAKRKMGMGESFTATKKIRESSEFDSTSVISKLKSLEKQDQSISQPMATFGLEDETGNVVKVSVPVDQAEDFEKSLQAALTTDDDTNIEIAEILFDLKDRFDILDVDWGDVVEDEEEIQPVDPDAPIDPNAPVDGEELPIDGELPPEGEDTGEVQSLLTQIIDMMKADAEARTADAKAREAESQAKEAEAASIQAAAKVRQEEQILDMETHNKKQKEIGKEAKRLAQLAQWKHEMAGGDDEAIDDFIPGYSEVTDPVEPVVQREENEEVRAKVLQHPLTSILLSKSRAK